MLKSKITASVVALSMTIPATSWGSNILEDDKLSFQSKKGITNHIKEEPSTLEKIGFGLLGGWGRFVLGGGDDPNHGKRSKRRIFEITF